MESQPGPPAASRLADNVVHFARVLRAAGVPVGTDRVVLALQSLQLAGIEARHDFHAVLCSCLIHRAEHRPLFEQAFHAFWRDPDLLRQILQTQSRRVGTGEPRQGQADRQNWDRAFSAGRTEPPPAGAERQRAQIDALLAWSDREQLRKADRRVHAFVFGTRLTHVTRQLRARDPDVAVAGVVDAAADWSGGTRIAYALHEFNLRWARRVLSRAPTVLFVSDGLEQGDPEQLGREAERMSKSCRRLVWLNPLLRYEQFQPHARGVRALLPYVHAFLPVHNIDSLLALAQVLATRAAGGRRGVGHAPRAGSRQLSPVVR